MEIALSALAALLLVWASVAIALHLIRIYQRNVAERAIQAEAVTEAQAQREEARVQHEEARVQHEEARVQHEEKEARKIREQQERDAATVLIRKRLERLIEACN